MESYTSVIISMDQALLNCLKLWKIMLFRNVHWLPFCFRIVHWASSRATLLMGTATSTLNLIKVWQLLWRHPRTKGPKKYERPSDKVKNRQFPGIQSQAEKFWRNGSWPLGLQWEATPDLGWVSMGPNVHESHFIELLRYHSPDGSPALLCAQLLEQDTRGERKSPPEAGSHGHTNQKLCNKWVQICALVKEKRHQLWSQTDLRSSLGSATYYIHDLRQIIHSLRLNVLTFKIGKVLGDVMVSTVMIVTNTLLYIWK